MNNSLKNKWFLITLLLPSFVVAMDSDSEDEDSVPRVQQQRPVRDKVGFVEGLFASAGKQIANAVRGFSGGFAQNLHAGNAFEKTIQNIMETLGEALKESLKEGGVFDRSQEDVINAIHRSFEKMANEVRDLYGEGGEISGAMEEISSAFKKFVDEFPFLKMAQNLGEGVSNGVKGTGNIIGMVGSGRGQIQLVAFTGALMSAWYGSKVAWRVIEDRWQKPALVIEQCNRTWRKYFMDRLLKRTPLHSMSSIILEKETADRFKQLVASTRNVCAKVRAGKKGVRYRNILLYGPPGTGKTLGARVLAEECGMNWVMMTGSSFSKYDAAEGIVEMDRLFAKARSSKNLMIIIDEADSFLGKRDGQDSNGKAYQLLNNFLNYTGEGSDRFMIVFVTNHPEMFDDAIARRIQEAVEIKLPGVAERELILAKYRDDLLLNPTSGDMEIMESARKILTAGKITQLAEQTEGLSGDELREVMNSIKMDAETTADGRVTEKLVDRTVVRIIEKNKNFMQGGFAAVYGKNKRSAQVAVASAAVAA